MPPLKTQEDMQPAKPLTPKSGMAPSAVKQWNTSPAMLMINWGMLVILLTPLPFHVSRIPSASS